MNCGARGQSQSPSSTNPEAEMTLTATATATGQLRPKKPPGRLLGNGSLGGTRTLLAPNNTVPPSSCASSRPQNPKQPKLEPHLHSHLLTVCSLFPIDLDTLTASHRFILHACTAFPLAISLLCCCALRYAAVLVQYRQSCRHSYYCC